MNRSFEGTVALITGGTTGIGLATATQLAHKGAAVVIAARNQENGLAAVDSIQADGGTATFVQTDVMEEDQVQHLVRTTVDTYGRLDFAFNNAGMEALGPIGDMPSGVFEKLMSVNVNGIWYSMKHEIAYMLQSGGGVIVNTSSVAGGKGMAGLSAYSASKHAVNGLTKSLALEYAQAGIRINGIMPGPVATPMMERVGTMMPGAAEQFAAATAVKRVASPQEIADAVLWLFSDDASFINAAIIPVDGGMIAL